MLDSLNKEGTLMLPPKTAHACPTLAIFKLDKHFEIYLAQDTVSVIQLLQCHTQIQKQTILA